MVAKITCKTIYNTTIMNPFNSIEDIEDVRIIIKAKGKHYSLVVNKELATDAEGREMRIACLGFIMNCHQVVDTALEDIKPT